MGTGNNQTREMNLMMEDAGNLKELMKTRWMPWLACAILVAMLGIPPGATKPATVSVEFSADGLGFEATSNKDIGNVIVVYCDLSHHKHDDLTGKVFNHTEAQTIVGVYVKSGDNNNPNGPPGAGEWFPNPYAECDGNGDPNGDGGDNGNGNQTNGGGNGNQTNGGGNGNQTNGGGNGNQTNGNGPINGQPENGNGNNDCLPHNLTVVAQAGPTNHLSWDLVPDGISYIIYRAVGADPFVLLDTLPAGSVQYDDNAVSAGTVYRYAITVVNDEGEVRPCPPVEVTTIPVFPSTLAPIAAGAISLAAYALLRRRR